MNSFKRIVSSALVTLVFLTPQAVHSTEEEPKDPSGGMPLGVQGRQELAPSPDGYLQGLVPSELNAPEAAIQQQEADQAVKMALLNPPPHVGPGRVEICLFPCGRGRPKH